MKKIFQISSIILLAFLLAGCASSNKTYKKHQLLKKVKKQKKKKASEVLFLDNIVKKYSHLKEYTIDELDLIKKEKGFPYQVVQKNINEPINGIVTIEKKKKREEETMWNYSKGIFIFENGIPKIAASFNKNKPKYRDTKYRMTNYIEYKSNLGNSYKNDCQPFIEIYKNTVENYFVPRVMMAGMRARWNTLIDMKYENGKLYNRFNKDSVNESIIKKELTSICSSQIEKLFD